MVDDGGDLLEKFTAIVEIISTITGPKLKERNKIVAFGLSTRKTLKAKILD